MSSKSYTSHHRDLGIRSNIACPHCRAATRTRTSRSVTGTYRQLTLICLNPECGATYGADLAITHMISPSARPDPSVQLRESAPRGRSADNDRQPRTVTGPEVPRPANDDDVMGVAMG